LTERQNIIPAPYMARAQWVALQTRDAIAAEELSRLLRESYEMVLAKLPKKMSNMIAAAESGGKAPQTRQGPKKRREVRRKIMRKSAVKKKR
jgi:hypothetical protein